MKATPRRRAALRLIKTLPSPADVHAAWPVSLGGMALACLAAWPAAAQQPDAEPLAETLQVRIGQSLAHDSNVFRLSDAVAASVLGSSSQSDTYGVTTLGAKLDKRYGLQRIEFDVNAQNYRFSRYDYLDFTALNYAAAWHWAVTPRFQGKLLTDRVEYLDNSVDGINQGEANRRIERSNVLDAEYQLGAAWRLLAGVYERSLKNTLSQTDEADSSQIGTEAGVRYVFATGNSVAYRYRRSDGDYSERSSASTEPSEFSDWEHELSFEWGPTAGTTVRGQMAYQDRRHTGFSDRDFSGVRGQVLANWAVTGKTRIEAGYVRELGTYQTLDSSYYQGDRLFVSPVWKPSEKTAVRLRLEQGERQYKGGATPSGRRDTLTQAGLSFEWDAMRALKLIGSVKQDKRNSNLDDYDYKANIVAVSALLSF